MELEKTLENKLISRILTSLVLRKTFELREVTVRKKGLKIKGIGTDEHGHSLQPQKEYGLITPALFQVNHRLRMLAIVSEAESLAALREALTAYVLQYATVPEPEIMWPVELIPEAERPPDFTGCTREQKDDWMLYVQMRRQREAS